MPPPTDVKAYAALASEFYFAYAGFSGVLGFAANKIPKSKVSGWISSKVFNKLDRNVQSKMVAAISKGIVSPKANNGIIKLAASEVKKTGYTYKLKILGKGGDIRIYGNRGSNGHFLFDKLGSH